MTDYIDRNAAIEALRKFADDCPGSAEAATAAGTTKFTRSGSQDPSDMGHMLCNPNPPTTKPEET